MQEKIAQEILDTVDAAIFEHDNYDYFLYEIRGLAFGLLASMEERRKMQDMTLISGKSAYKCFDGYDIEDLKKSMRIGKEGLTKNERD